MAPLENDVHPLLARGRFARNVDYAKVFLQPARLASRMLTTPQAEHYLLALITKSKHRSALRGASKDLRHRFWPGKDIEKLSELDRSCVQSWLHRVAETITYSVRTCGEGALAETKKLPLDSSESSLGHSIICISRSKHYNPLRGHLPAAERIIRQFNLAVALLHELAHAISYSITAREDEDFFAEAPVAEAGFEFEARLFGACPSFSSSTPQVVQWYPWPSRILLGGDGDVESYDLTDLCRNTSKVDDGGAIARVSFRYMRSLFSEQSWQRALELTPAATAVAILAPEIRKMRIRKLLADKKSQPRKLLSRVNKYSKLGSCRYERHHSHSLRTDR